MNWFLAGLFFGPMGLLAAAGLSDMRLRTYLYQIGTAQGAIQDKKTTSTRKELPKLESRYVSIQKDASESETWKAILEVIGDDISRFADRSNSIVLEDNAKIKDSRGDLLAEAKVIDKNAPAWEWEVRFENF